MLQPPSHSLCAARFCSQRQRSLPSLPSSRSYPGVQELVTCSQSSSETAWKCLFCSRWLLNI